MRRFKTYLVFLVIPVALLLLMIFFPDKYEPLINFLRGDNGVYVAIFLIVILWCIVYRLLSKIYTSYSKNINMVFRTYMFISALFAVCYLNVAGHIIGYGDVLYLVLPAFLGVYYLEYRKNNSSK